MDGYKTDILCTYLNIDAEPELQDEGYRVQMLQIFNLNRWDDVIVNSITEKLFFTIQDIFRNNTKSIYLRQCNIINVLTKLRNTENLHFLILMCGTDDLSVFKLLFKFEFYQYAHTYFCYILNNYKTENIDLSVCFNMFENKDYNKENKLLQKSYEKLYENIK